MLLTQAFLPPNYATTSTTRKTKAHCNASKRLSNIIKTTMSMKVHAATTCSNAHVEVSSSISDDIRRNIWPDYFLNYIPQNAEMLAQRESQVNALKEEVRKELLENIAHKPVVEQLEIIDDIQRLGVGYHFENEIEEALKQIYETHCRCDNNGDDLDLNHASLKFRLLRQQGFYIPSDMFKKFLDGNGKFQASLSGDVHGMLSLYEASHLRTYGDDILDEALTFTTTHLKSMSNKLAHPLSLKVARALDQPLLYTRVLLVWRLDIIFPYMDMILAIARPCSNLPSWTTICFNRCIKRSFKNSLGMDVYIGLPCNVRDQIAECHYAGLGTCDERPEYSLGRMVYFKTALVGTIVDDLYDVCEIEDLNLMTEAIQRWDKGCVNQLPDGLKPIYIKLLDTFEEIKQQLAKEGRVHAFDFAIDAFKILWPHHMKTRKWRRDKYVPTLEEYLTTAPATGFKFLTIIGWLGVGEFTTEEASKWAQHYSKVIDGLCTFYRVMDDLAEDYMMDKNTTDELSVVSCYMKQHNVTEKTQAFAELQKIIDNIWKDINFALLRPSIMPFPLVQRFVTQARFLHIGFYKGDGFSFPDKTPMRENCRLLYKDPIPI